MSRVDSKEEAVMAMIIDDGLQANNSEEIDVEIEKTESPDWFKEEFTALKVI